MVGDVSALLVLGDGGVRMFANTCRHRGHELLPEGESSHRRAMVCPYHAWSYDLAGALMAAPGFRDVAGFDAGSHGLVELPVEIWEGWVLGHALHPLGSAEVPSFAEHLGEMGRIVAPYAPGSLGVADRHTYEVAANWKVIAENYHECYHCPLIHPELCQVSPPDSGDNYDLPGAWIGGSMDLRDGMATMSLTGERAAPPLPGVDPGRVEYLHLLPNLLLSAHPDYVMAHRLVPLGARPDLDRVHVAGPARRGRHRRGAGCGGVLGHHQPPGLGGLRVGAARPGQPALPARTVRAQRGRRDAAGGGPERAYTCRCVA